MNMRSASTEFIEFLSPLEIDETKFFDTFPSRNRNEPPQEVLNIHGVRLYASIKEIGIKENSCKILIEPDLSEGPGNIVVCAEAEDLSTGRRYYAEVEQQTHYPAKGNGAARLNPNYRETAITRAERNAMLGLIPARYLVACIKKLSTAKNELRNEEEKIHLARASARRIAKMCEDNGISSKDIFNTVKDELREHDMDAWKEPQWRILKQHLENALKEQAPEPEEEEVAEVPEVEEQPMEPEVEPQSADF